MRRLDALRLEVLEQEQRHASAAVLVTSGRAAQILRASRQAVHKYLAAGDLVGELVETSRVQRGTRRPRMGYAWRADAVGKPRKPPQGLALQWWLRQLESPATRRALLTRHPGAASDVD